MKTILLLSSTVLIFLQAHSQMVETHSFAPNLAIPDNDSAGISDSHSIASAIPTLTEVSVQLNISGGFNGDLYLYLAHDSGISILLNRTGKTSSSPLGYPDSGFNITLKDSAPNGDIHLYRSTLNPGGSALTGTWAPDGRLVDPGFVLDTSPRTAPLSAFTGMAGAGTWTLFAADTSPLSQSTLQSWSLELIGVPEPGEWAAITASGLAIFAWLRRNRSGRRVPGVE